MRKIFKIFLLIVFSGLIYSFGALSLKYRLEPIPTLAGIKNSVEANDKKNYIDNTLFYENHLQQEINLIKNIYDSIDVLEVRGEIIEDFILPKSKIELKSNIEKSFDCFSDPIVYSTEFYGIKQKGVLERRNGKSLVIYLQGHRGDPCDFEDYNEIKTGSENFDFLSFSMFDIGMNKMDSISFPIRIPQHTESYVYKNNNYKNFSGNHSVIQYYYDKEHPNVKPLSLFLSSPYYIIREVIKKYKYEKVVIMGISGGGWYSTILSGLIPEINRTYSFNGSLPMLYRINTDSSGDYEQQFSKLWESYDYYTFYILGLFDSESQLNRSSQHIYAERDRCCYSSPEVAYFEKSINALNLPNLKVQIFDDKTEHDIEVGWMVKELENID